MSSDKSIDVIIPTRNRDHRLRSVITPLLDDPAVARIIVVNDADRTVPAAKGPDLTPISTRAEVIHTGGIGPAKARQLGAHETSADVLLFLDDDVVPEPGLPTRHLEQHRSRNHLLVCGYTPVTPRGPGVALSPEAQVYRASYEKRCRQYDLDPESLLTNLWGGNFSLPREDALAIGLASPSFLESWHEDRDFGIRCLRAGMEAKFDRTIRADHEYERGWAATKREAYLRGYSLVVLHELHGDLIGPFDEGFFERNHRWPVRLTVRTVPRHGLTEPATRIFSVLYRVGGAVRLRSLQLLSVRMLRLLRAATGARDRVRSRPKTP